MKAFAFLAALLLGVGACGGEPARTVSVRLRVAPSAAPKDARVIVDDRFVGTLGEVSAKGLAMPPGKHTVSVEAPGYFPWDRVIVAEGAAIPLDVAMTKLPE